VWFAPPELSASFAKGMAGERPVQEPTERPRCYLSHGEWAFLSSLVLHAGFLGGILGLALEQGRGSDTPFRSIDTQVRDCEIDVSLVVEDAVPVAAPKGVSTPTRPERVSLDDLASARKNELPPTRAPAANETRAIAGNGKNPPTPTGGGTGLESRCATFFQIPFEAKTVVYVIDRSGSMGINDSLQVAKEELLASLRHLPEGTRFQIIAYNRLAEPARIRGSYALTLVSPESVAAVETILQGIRAEGGTNHLQALKRALLLRAEVIFYLTDGDDLRRDEIDAITRLNHDQSVIHAVVLNAVSSPGKERAVAELVRANRGICKVVAAAQ
jgi:hypothetical protein